MTRQCSSCGGFCKPSGCERANVEVKSAVSEKTREPVFPTIHNGSTLAGERGMTLRDLFAGLAMQGLLANPEWWNYMGGTDSAETARTAFLHADAMLKAREAK